MKEFTNRLLGRRPKAIISAVYDEHHSVEAVLGSIETTMRHHPEMDFEIRLQAGGGTNGKS